MKTRQYPLHIKMLLAAKFWGRKIDQSHLWCGNCLLWKAQTWMKVTATPLAGPCGSSSFFKAAHFPQISWRQWLLQKQLYGNIFKNQFISDDMCFARLKLEQFWAKSCTKANISHLHFTKPQLHATHMLQCWYFFHSVSASGHATHFQIHKYKYTCFVKPSGKHPCLSKQFTGFLHTYHYFASFLGT